MLNTSFAFIVMTAEDEQSDGSINPRMIVIHEAGLFQGKLGFTKAIVLLERGCEEFSNIDGLGQIRFSQRNISEIFEEIRRVREREGIFNLGDHFDQFISQQIESGRFGNASEVVRASLRLLEDEEHKLAALRQALIDGENSGRTGKLDPQKIRRKAKKKAGLRR